MRTAIMALIGGGGVGLGPHSVALLVKGAWPSVLTYEGKAPRPVAPCLKGAGPIPPPHVLFLPYS